MNETNNLTNAAAVAQFRFALIAPVIQDLFPDASKTAYYKRVTEKPLTLPDGATKLYDYKTVEKWVSQYRHGGIDALMPKERIDKGTSRVLSDTAIEEIYRLKENFPRLNATQIHQKLIADSFLSAGVSVDAVQRFVKHNDLKSARNPNLRDRKAFEEDMFGKMWQADTCYLPHITEDGRCRRVYCVMIIDDHSRLLVGGELFYHDNAANFQKVFHDAIATYGIPDKLYVDNGAAYSNEQLSLICGAVGTVLLHTRVRDGASKAKVERHFRTLKERWLYALDLSSITSLSRFNGLLKDYMRSYNTTFHSGIHSAPFDRYQNTKNHVRCPASSDWLTECFLNRITRKVGKDSTVSINKESFDVPMQFISMKVEVRYQPNDMDSAFILYDGNRFPLLRTDKYANCHTKRNNAPAIDYSKLGGASHV